MIARKRRAILLAAEQSLSKWFTAIPRVANHSISALVSLQAKASGGKLSAY